MLNAIYKLGKLYLEKENLDEIEVLLDNRSTKAVILVNLVEDESGNFSYEKCIQEDFNPEKRIKYLYRKKSSNGPDYSPSCFITNVNTSFNKKFCKWFEKNKNKDDFFKNIFLTINENKESIQKDIEDIYDTINIENSNVILSLLITKNNQDYYVGDYDIFVNVFKENIYEKYYKNSYVTTKGEGICFLCDEHKEVFGLVSNEVGFKFSTPEKKGNVPGLLSSEQWKLLPICGDCASYLELGKKFVDEYLDFTEFRLRYYVIPNFLFDSEEGFDKLYDILKILKTEETQNSQDVVIIENKIKRILRNIDDYVELKFLFYQSSNSAFDILAYVESVIPSWLNRLYESQRKIADLDFFNETNLKSVFNNKELTGNFIDLINDRETFKSSKEKWFANFLRTFTYDFSTKIYLDLVVDVLSEKKLDYDFLMSRFMNKIRSNFRNGEHYALKVSMLKSLMLLILFNDLDLIKGVKKMDLTSDEFDIDSILNSPDKKASFLLGVLTKRLLNTQYRELKSSPFYNKLWGLSLDQKKVKKLYPMVINKLREYDKAYKELEEELSINLMNSNDNWNLTRDETSYFFVLGFTLPYFNITEEDDLDE